MEFKNTSNKTNEELIGFTVMPSTVDNKLLDNSIIKTDGKCYYCILCYEKDSTIAASLPEKIKELEVMLYKYQLMKTLKEKQNNHENISLNNFLLKPVYVIAINSDEFELFFGKL